MAGLQGRPILRDLSNDVVPSVAYKWYTLGVQLLDDQDVKVLTNIETDYRGDSATCCTKMLERWLDMVATANWEHLITGLRSPNVKLHKLANELTLKLGGTLPGQISTHTSDQSLILLASNGQPPSPRHNSLSPTSPHPQFEISDEPALPDKYSTEFGYLVSNVTEIIQNETKSQCLEGVKRALCQVKIHAMSSKPLFSNDKIVEIKKCTDMFQLTEQCREHWTWNEYSLLRLIVKKSGSENAKSELKKFQRKVHARQKLKDLGDEWLQKTQKYPDDYEKMIVIVDEDYDEITVEQFEEVEKFISKVTQLSVSAMQVDRFGETNSVFFEWRIPAETVQFVIMLAYQNKEVFLQRSILLLRIAGMDIINLCAPARYPKLQLQYSQEEATETIQRLRAKSNDTAEHNEELMAEVSTVIGKCYQLENELETVRSDNKDKDDTIHQLRQESDSLKTELEDKKKDIDSLNEQLSSYERRGSTVSDHDGYHLGVHDEYMSRLKDLASLGKDHGYESMPSANKDDMTSGGDSLASFPLPASGPSSYQTDMQKSLQSTEPDSAPTSTTVKQMAAAINSKSKDEPLTAQKDVTNRSKSISPSTPKKSLLKSSRRIPASNSTGELQSALKKRWSIDDVLEDSGAKVKQLSAAQKRVSWNEQRFSRETEIDMATGATNMDSELVAKLKMRQEKISAAEANSSLP